MTDPTRILLVDDDEDHFLLTRDLLSRVDGCSYKLDWVSTFAEAEAAILREEHDLFLIDYNLGVRNGLELVRNVVANGSRTPIIVLTGRDDRSVDLEAMKAGASDYLAKGELTSSLLERSIRYALERARNSDALRTREEQLRHSQKMEAVGRLAGGVAHNFNNLLTVIACHGEHLLAYKSDPDATRSHAKDILKATQRAAALTLQLLALGEKQLLQPKVLDLNDVIRETMKFLESVVGADVKILMSLAPDLGSVKVDPTQVCQVIAHLAINAREAMSHTGKLTLETKNVELDEQYERTHAGAKAGSYVMLAMTDTGCGMAGETISHMFEPFFTTKSPGKGTGLGLATVQGIVKQSGGNVSVESEPGEGTTFRVYLPRIEEAPPATLVPPAKQEARGGTETILLVDDEDSVRTSISQLLSDSGYRVLEAETGPEALRISENHHAQIDLLVTDVVMPGMNGRVLAGHLAKARPETKLLYVSGFTNDALIDQGVLDGQVALLQKPFALSALLTTIRELLGNDARDPREQR